MRYFFGSVKEEEGECERDSNIASTNQEWYIFYAFADSSGTNGSHWIFYVSCKKHTQTLTFEHFMGYISIARARLESAPI